MDFETQTLLLRILVGIIVTIYFVFEWKDRNLVKDEREEQIKKSALEKMHNVYSYSLLPLVALYVMFPKMDAIYPIVVYACCCCVVYPVVKHRMRGV